MDAKVTAEGMVVAIEGAAAVILDSMTPGAKRTARIAGLHAAANYILNAQAHIDGHDAGLQQLGNEMAQLRSQIAERDAQIAEMRKVTGPKCPNPECGHWLGAEHDPITNDAGAVVDFCCWRGDNENEPLCPCEITAADLLANHPLIAAELGLTEANDGNA